MWNLSNTTKPVNKAKKLTHRYGEQTHGYQQVREKERGGNIRLGNEELQTVKFKISYKDILYNTRNKANIL